MKSQKHGFTLVEVMIVVAIIALLAAIAIPNVLRGRTSANESASIGNMRSLTSGLEMYRSVFASYPDVWVADMYTNANPDYGPANFAANTMNGAATATTQGYVWTFTPAANGGAAVEPNVTTYSVISIPQNFPTSGTRGFYADETGIIRHCQCAAQPCGAAVITDNPIDQPPTPAC